MATTPRSEHAALISALRDPQPGDEFRDPIELFREAADAIETLVKERDELKREMHARELHHFEEEQKSAGLAAEVERLRLVHAGQSRLALSAVFMADVDDDEGVQAFYREWVRNHDAALIESLANDLNVRLLDAHGPSHVSYELGWLRERARRVREGEA